MPVPETHPYIAVVTETYNLFNQRKPSFNFPKGVAPTDYHPTQLTHFMEPLVSAWDQDMHKGVLKIASIGALNQAPSKVLSFYARLQAISSHLPFYPLDQESTQDSRAMSYIQENCPNIDSAKIDPLNSLLKKVGRVWGARFLETPAYADSLAGMVNQHLFEMNRLWGQSIKSEKSTALKILELAGV